MRHLLIILSLVVLISCKKDDPDPEPQTPDYAETLVGTYIGTEVQLGSDNMTQEYNNSSKTMTITRVDKNKIMVSTFNIGIKPEFSLTSKTSNVIKLTPDGVTEVGTGNNEYDIPSKKVYIYFYYSSINKYVSFQGTKQ
jgi:hypothetical protein